MVLLCSSGAWEAADQQKFFTGMDAAEDAQSRTRKRSWRHQFEDV